MEDGFLTGTGRLGIWDRGLEVGWGIHPGRLIWNLRITHLERNIIFQTYMIMFHVNLQGHSFFCNVFVNLIV